MHRLNLTHDQALTLHATGTLDLPRPQPCPTSGSTVLIALPLTLITDIIDHETPKLLTTTTVVRYPWHTEEQDATIDHHSAHHRRVATDFNDGRVDQTDPQPIPAAELPSAYVHHRAHAQRIPGGLRLTSLTLHTDLEDRIRELNTTYLQDKRTIGELIATLGDTVTDAQRNAFAALP